MRAIPMTWKAAMIAVCGSLSACGSSGAVSAQKDGYRREARVAADDSFPMRVARAAHSAVVLAGGRVLLIGGCVAESCEGGPDSATVDSFDVRRRSFEHAGALTMRRVGTTALPLASGHVLIAGGWVGARVSSSVELFNPGTGTSRHIGDLSEPRADIAAVTLPDGRILLAGGYADGAAKRNVDIFDPESQAIRPAGELATARAGAGAALLRNGRVLLVGGGTTGPGRLVPTASAEIFDPLTGKASRTGSLSQARYKHATVSLGNDQVLVLGGSDERDASGKLNSLEAFDARSGTFSPAGRMLEARYKIAGAVVLLPQGRVLIAGGGQRAELFDPSILRSAPVGPAFHRRLNFATATMLQDGSVLIAGGYHEEGIRMNDRAWIIKARDLAPRPLAKQ